MSTQRIREIHRDAETATAIFVVESLETLHGKTRTAYHLHGKIEPVAIVVYTQYAIHALDMAGESMELERLRENFPDLDLFATTFDDA